MGCGCSKRPGGVLQEDIGEDQKIKVLYTSKRSSFASGRLNYVEVIGDGVGLKDRDTKIKSNGANPKPQREDSRETKQWKAGQLVHNPNPRLSNPPKHLEGECVAAGWPSWLSSVAGEAVKGWIPRRADSFEKLDKIGQGTYSNVYKARDLETGKVVALKKVRFDNLEPESVRFMAREIQVLRRLDHPNIVKLEGLVTSRMSCSLYLVFEYMEHDLAGLAASPGTKFSEPQVKYYLQQLLKGLDHCHRRGVLHRDIKGSNLLLDNSGVLKIADFGLATFFSQDQRQPLTSRVVTLWYRPPELLLGATEYGVGVDLWSTGCILAELLAGKPIMPGRTEVEQLHKIFKLCGSPSEEYWRKSKLPHATIFKPKQPYKRCIAETFRDFPPSSLSSLETLLAIEPADRGTAAGALESEFFTTKPFACDPSSLPKYPPSKEFDAKLRDEEARRQRAAGVRVQVQQGGDDRLRPNKAIPAPDANAELPASIQKRRLASHSVKSQSEKFNPRHEDSAVGFPIDPPRPLADRPAVVGTRAGFGPVANSTANVKGLRKHNEAQTQSMDFSRPVQPPTYRSNSSKSLAAAHPRQSDGFSGLHSHKYKHPELPTKPAAELQWNVNGANRAQNERLGSRGGNAGGRQADRIHFSGPLLHPSANLEDILGQHERRIQQAVRRSRQDKDKDKDKDKNHHSRSRSSARNAWPTLAHQNHGPPLSRSGRWRQTRPMSGGENAAEVVRGLSALIENPEREHE